MSCNTRCKLSKSKRCRCSCGGKNHGIWRNPEYVASLPLCTPIRIRGFKDMWTRLASHEIYEPWVQGFPNAVIYHDYELWTSWGYISMDDIEEVGVKGEVSEDLIY